MIVTDQKNEASEKSMSSDIELNGFYLFVKRAFDLCVALIALAILAIPMIIISCLIRIESKGNAIYSQKRVGKGGKPFVFYKFRSMYIDTPVLASRDLTDADSHITKMGKILRNTSLDELPQLFNIIKGDMSFIGPRPVILEETELIEKRMQCGAYAVLPGLTGYAQINGRDFVGIDSKAEYDGYYAHNASIKFDIKIFLKTILYVLRRLDINEGAIKEEKPTEEKEEITVGGR